MKPPLSSSHPPRRVTLLSRFLRRADRSGERSVEIGKAMAGEAQNVVPASPAPAESRSTGSPFYVEAREQIRRHAWGRAQRALEAASRADPECPAALDLQAVRTIRRALRRTARWPSDVEAHLDLGRAYFDLDLGDDALAEFLTVQRLAPQRYEGYALAALEYLYRGEYTRAMSTWLQARERNPSLPVLDDVLGSLPVR